MSREPSSTKTAMWCSKMPDRLTEQWNPVKKQLLVVVSDPIIFYIPRDEDVPINALASE